MNKNIVLIVFIYILVLHCNCFSQNKSGSIKGTVLDNNGIAVSEVKVRLISFSEQKTIGAITTDSTGKYFFGGLIPGRYNLKISNISKQINKNVDVTISDSEPDINLDSMETPPKINTTDEIEVNAVKEIFEVYIDKNVYNVSKDNSVKGMNLIDVLKKTPFVSVENMSIFLKSNPNVKFKINDSPVNISGEQLYQYLLSVSAENIQTIEVYTNPGVKQSAEGTGGVINIIFKKEERIPESKNINAGAYYYTTNSYNGFLGLGLNEKNYDLSLFYNYSRFNSRSDFERNKIIYQPRYSKIVQSGTNPSPSNTHYLNFNLDKAVFKNGNLNLFGSFLNNTSDAERTGNNSYYDISGNQTNKYRSENNSYTKFSSIDINSALSSKIFNEKNILNVTASFKTDKIASSFLGTQVYEPSYNKKNYFIKSDFNQRLYNFYLKPEISIKDYKNIIFNFGGELTGMVNNNENNIYSYDSTLNQFSFDTGNSNNFEYKRNIYAAYLEAIINFAGLSFSGGLRAEQTNSKGNLIGTNTFFENNYLDFFPAAAVLKAINSENSFRLSYSKRLNRPEPFYLNPFVNKNNVNLSISTGNPFLLPEYSHTLEAGYINNANGIVITPVLFYRVTNNVTAFVKSIVDTNVTFSTYKNLNRTNSYGVDLSVSGLLFNQAYFNGGFSYYKSELKGDTEGDINANSLSTLKLNLSLNMPITLILSADIYYNYQGKKLKAQGYTEPSQFLNMGLSLRLMENKLNLRLSVNDIFNTQKLKSISEYTDSYEEVINKQNSQSLMLGVNFIWGELGDKKSKDKPKKTKVPDSDLKDSY